VDHVETPAFGPGMQFFADAVAIDAEVHGVNKG
jgi:hypothetical protein